MRPFLSSFTAVLTTPAPQRHSRKGILLWLAVVAATAGGCAANGDGWSFAKSWRAPRMPWKNDADAEPQVPQRLVATWTDATYNRPGEKPQRGFGGRLVFFGEDHKTPVPVEGQLVVYAFDETDRSEHDTAPTRRYVVPSKEFAQRKSDSKLGPSYSVWIPWDKVGGPSRKISLIARFEPASGGLVLSEQTHHYLPGPNLTNEPPHALAKSARSETGVQTASFEGQASGRATAVTASASHEEPSRAAPTTIVVSPRLAAQLAREVSADRPASPSAVPDGVERRDRLDNGER